MKKPNAEEMEQRVRLNERMKGRKPLPDADPPGVPHLREDDAGVASQAEAAATISEEREACAQAMEEMAMKYEEVVRWALNKGAEVIRKRAGQSPLIEHCAECGTEGCDGTTTYCICHSKAAGTPTQPDDMWDDAALWRQKWYDEKGRSLEVSVDNELFECTMLHDYLASFKAASPSHAPTAPQENPENEWCAKSGCGARRWAHRHTSMEIDHEFVARASAPPTCPVEEKK